MRANKVFWVGLAMLAASAGGLGPARAQIIEIDPMIGYQTGGKILSSSGTLEFGSAMSYGLIVDIRVDDQVFLELSYSGQPTDLTLTDSTDPTENPNGKLTDLTVHYIQGGIHYEIVRDKLTPFGQATAGVTIWDPTGSSRGSQSAFSVVIGGGAKYFFSDRFGVRAMARLASSFLTGGGDTFCDPINGCVREVENATIMQFDLSVGLVLVL